SETVRRGSWSCISGRRVRGLRILRRGRGRRGDARAWGSGLRAQGRGPAGLGARGSGLGRRGKGSGTHCRARPRGSHGARRRSDVLADAQRPTPDTRRLGPEPRALSPKKAPTPNTHSGVPPVMPKLKTIYFCTECGNESPRWAGRCPACDAWNTLVEEPT